MWRNAPELEQDTNLRVVMDMLRASPKRPVWEHVRAESAEIKTLWSQYFSLKIRDGILLRLHKNQGFLDEWQVVAPQMICTRIFHHKLAAHQGVVHTPALIKQWFYWPSMQKYVHCPLEYVEWLRRSIRDAHVMARPNLKGGLNPIFWLCQ